MGYKGWDCELADIKEHCASCKYYESKVVHTAGMIDGVVSRCTLHKKIMLKLRVNCKDWMFFEEDE